MWNILAKSPSLQGGLSLFPKNKIWHRPLPKRTRPDVRHLSPSFLLQLLGKYDVNRYRLSYTKETHKYELRRVRSGFWVPDLRLEVFRVKLRFGFDTVSKTLIHCNFKILISKFFIYKGTTLTRKISTFFHLLPTYTTLLKVCRWCSNVRNVSSHLCM